MEREISVLNLLFKYPSAAAIIDKALDKDGKIVKRGIAADITQAALDRFQKELNARPTP